MRILKLIWIGILLTGSLVLNAQFQGMPGAASNSNSNTPMGLINGQVLDSITGKPVEFATISLELSEFEKIINGVTTDENGKFEFDKVVKGKFKINASFIGYTSKEIDSISITATHTQINLGKIFLRPEAQALGEVEITGQGALIENKVDKIVYNAERDVTSVGGVATDILRKVPLVTVDQDGNVQLRGNSNILVLINGKPSQVFATSVADALRTIPADQVKSVEVITNPGAKYDAEGAGGIINIITKKKNIDGINGAIGLSVGTRMNNANASLNIRRSSLSLLTSAGVNYFIPQTGYFTNTRVNNTSNGEFILKQNGENKTNRLALNGTLGLDYDINSHNNISTTIKANRLRQGGTGIANVQLDNPDPISDYSYTRNSSNYPVFGGFDWVTDYKRNFSNPAQEFSAAFQWNQGLNRNDFVVNQNGLIFIDEKSYNIGKNNEFTTQADYVHPFSNGSNLEVGAKTIIRKLSSDIKYTILDTIQDTYYTDVTRSNLFNYNQNVYAAYTSYTFTINKKFNFKTGLRFEHTAISSPDILDFDNQYSSLFPSLSISRTFKNYSTLKFGYNRRLQRPSQFYLNPFRNESDPLNVVFGNPKLNPELTDNIELSYTGFFSGNFLNLSLYFRNSSDIIESYYSLISDTKGQTTFRNIGQNRSVGLSAFGSYQVTNNWVLRGGGNVYTYDIKSNLEGLSSNTYLMFNINFMTTLTLKNNWNIEGFGFFNAPRRTAQGKNPTFSFYEFGVKKEFWDKKGSIKLGCTQPFTEYRRFVTNISGPNFSQESEFKLPFRSINLAFNYSFGKAVTKQKSKKINNDDLKQGDNNGGF